jgi:hypothetical protein
MATALKSWWDKSVFVRNYWRFRKGKWEHVCDHYRSWPSC